MNITHFWIPKNNELLKCMLNDDWDVYETNETWIKVRRHLDMFEILEPHLDLGSKSSIKGFQYDTLYIEGIVGCEDCEKLMVLEKNNTIILDSKQNLIAIDEELYPYAELSYWVRYVISRVKLSEALLSTHVYSQLKETRLRELFE
jgi:hypothetical protein